MRGNARRIKQFEDLINDHGFSFSDIFRAKLGMTVASFARQHDFRRTEVSMTLHGKRTYPKIREALAAALQITDGELSRLIDRSADSENDESR